MPHQSRVALLALSFLLAACSAPPVTPAVTPTVPPSASPTAALPTAAPTMLATVAPTATSAPTTRAASATRTTAARTATPAPPKISWEVRTLLVAPGEPGRLYALLANRNDPTIAQQMRFGFSNDQGTTWTLFAGGLPTEPPCLHNVNLDYATPDALYASTCKGIYRWSANKWNLISSLETWVVAIVYKQPNILWAVANNETSGPVFRSNDGGATWNFAAHDLTHFNGIANLAIDPRDANTLYAIINPKYAGSYLRRGNANGQWKTIPTPLNNNVIDTGMTIDGASGALYVTTANYTAGSTGRWQIWRTLNPNALDVNAVAWEMVHDFGAGPTVSLLASGLGPQGLVIYARFWLLEGDSYVQRSPDGGKTWTRLGLPGF